MFDELPAPIQRKADIKRNINNLTSDARSDRLKTSFFKSPNARSSNAVSIAIDHPSWFCGFEYKPLIPPADLEDNYRRGRITEAEYTKSYNLRLLALDPRQVFLDLGENAILLCHEPPGQICHRRLVAAWLEKCLNIFVPESHYREPKVML